MVDNIPKLRIVINDIINGKKGKCGARTADLPVGGVGMDLAVMRRDPCGTVDSDRVTKRSTRSDDCPARPDSDIPGNMKRGGGGLTPRLKAIGSPWVRRRCRHTARRMA